MNRSAMRRRLARLQRECDVSIAPTLLLSAACTVLVVLLGLNALQGEPTPPQAAEPMQQSIPPAT